MRDSVVEATISRDVLQMEEVRSPTLATCLGLLNDARLLCGLSKFDKSRAKSSGRSPRFMVHDPSLMVAACMGGPRLCQISEDIGALGTALRG